MNRREFIRAALAGLVAAILPKGKQAAPVPTVTYDDIDKLWRRNHGGMSIVGESGPERIGNPSALMIDSFGVWSPEIEVRGPFLKCHTLCITPIEVTDELMDDWIAMGWKPNG